MRALAWMACMLGAVMLLAAGALLGLERRWTPKAEASPEAAFLHGDIGLELAPLKYLLVMDDPRLGGRAFGLADGAAPGAWVARFGFIRRADAPADIPACAASGRDALPFGFTVTRKLPGSGSPFPVAFAGLACAACHSAEFVHDGTRHIVAGAGNPRLDIIAFGEAFKNAVQNPSVTADAVFDVYDERCGAPDGMAAKAGEWLEKRFMGFWLDTIRGELTRSAGKYDLSFPPSALTDAGAIPAGPSRTRAFRSVLRELLDLPGEGNFAFSKIPSTFLQATKMCGQYDGSICDHVARSQIAAYSSGGSITELAQPDVVDNIMSAAGFTLDLTPSKQGGAFAAIFPDAAPGRDETTRQAAERGRGVYASYCERCHGAPQADGRWTFPADRPDRPITPLSALGTDPVRLTFRHAARLPDAIWLAFPLPPGAGRELQRARLAKRIAEASKAGFGDEAALWGKIGANFEAAARRHPLGHPLSFADKTLIYDADPQTQGYQNNALPGLFLHAPYLHNASVPTLAQLINLEVRPGRFCRGAEPYDPAAVGYASPPPGPQGCPPEAPWLFDAARDGNSNAGHDFPWPHEEAQTPEHRAALGDLIEYLKTF